MGGGRWIAAGGAVLMLFAACAGQREAQRPSPRERQAAQVAELFEELGGVSVTDPSSDEWDFRPPGNVRPCCAFGFDLRLQLGGMPVPMFRMNNVVESGALGRHTFDSDMVSTKNDASAAFLSGEANGLTYTCRGGFIDVAHVRDYADWTVYLAGRIEQLLGTGGVLELPAEAGERFVYVAAAGELLIEEVGRRELALVLAQWVAFRLSIWHETATWFRWSTWEAFPEEASAFSPEDLYSNLLGINIAGSIVRSSPRITRLHYNRNMDRAVTSVLDRLGALSAAGTREAAIAVDGVWWDSRRRLPDKSVVLRRNFETGPLLRPWRVPPHHRTRRFSELLTDRCYDAEDAAPLAVPGTVSGLPIENLVRLDIRVSPEVAARLPLVAGERRRWLGHREVDRLVAAARLENRHQFGADADHPG